MAQIATKQVTLPLELAERLERDARAMGLDLPAYVVFLDACRRGLLDAKAQDAASFMFAQHSKSLEKLAK